MRNASQAHQLPVEVLKRHDESMAKLRGDGQCRIGVASLDLAEVFTTDNTLTSEAEFAQSAAFPQLLKPTRSRSA
jgi:hypothetical protein